MPIAQPLRQADLKVKPVNSELYLKMVRTQAQSEAGSVKSQYVEELQRGDSSVGALGLWACGQIVGAASYGVIQLPRDPDKVSGRIDVVVTPIHCRKRGIGALLMASLVEKFLQDFGSGLTHFSTIAVHPSVGRCVTKLGFEPVSGDVPLFRIRIDDDNRSLLTKRVNLMIRKTLSALRAECVRCQKFRWHQPWCVPEA